VGLAYSETIEGGKTAQTRRLEQKTVTTEIMSKAKKHSENFQKLSEFYFVYVVLCAIWLIPIFLIYSVSQSDLVFWFGAIWVGQAGLSLLEVLLSKWLKFFDNAGAGAFSDEAFIIMFIFLLPAFNVLLAVPICRLFYPNSEPPTPFIIAAITVAQVFTSLVVLGIGVILFSFLS
jgi:hypothetical protein